MDLYLMADWAADNVRKIDAVERPREQTLRWFDELREPLRRYLLCSGVSAFDADDVVQETFLRLYRHLEKDGKLENPCGWVFQVARNYLRDERKSARSKRTAAIESGASSDPRFADPGANPEHCALGEERSRRLRAAIERLPAQQRECMLLRASGLRYREIAEFLGIATSSVGPLVQRAMARLSEELA